MQPQFVALGNGGQRRQRVHRAGIRGPGRADDEPWYTPGPLVFRDHCRKCLRPHAVMIIQRDVTLDALFETRNAQGLGYGVVGLVRQVDDRPFVVPRRADRAPHAPSPHRLSSRYCRRRSNRLPPWPDSRRSPPSSAAASVPAAPRLVQQKDAIIAVDNCRKVVSEGSGIQAARRNETHVAGHAEVYARRLDVVAQQPKNLVEWHRLLGQRRSENARTGILGRAVHRLPAGAQERHRRGRPPDRARHHAVRRMAPGAAFAPAVVRAWPAHQRHCLPQDCSITRRPARDTTGTGSAPVVARLV